MLTHHKKTCQSGRVMLKQTTEQTEAARIALRGDARAASRGTAGGEVEDRHLRVCVAASEDAQPKTPAMWPFLTEGDADGSALAIAGCTGGPMRDGEGKRKKGVGGNSEQGEGNGTYGSHGTNRKLCGELEMIRGGF